MRTSLKLFLFLSIPIILVMVLFGILDQRQSRELFRLELAREGRALTTAIRVAIEDALRDQQVSDVHMLVDNFSGYEGVMGVRLFDEKGTLVYESKLLNRHPFAGSEALRRVLHGDSTVITYRRLAKDPIVSFMEPLSRPDGSLGGAIQVIQMESFVEQDSIRSRNSIVALTSIMILISGSILFLVTHYNIGKPVEALARSFREVGSGTLNARVPVRDRSELGQLAEEFNHMCERLSSAQVKLQGEREERQRVESQLRQAERLADLGRLAAGFAHEVGTPLNVISGRTEALLRTNAYDSETERNLRIIATQIERIAVIVQGMLDFARAHPPRIVPTHLANVLSEVIDFLDSHIRGSGTRLVLNLPSDLPPVPADSNQLHQVFLNLILNALDAMREGGTLQISIQRQPQAHPERDGEPMETQTVVFSDDGEGISENHVDHIFEPFFTTKDVGRGTGMGLAVCYGIIREHGGWIQVDSRRGKGTSISVHLPEQARHERELQPARRPA